MHKAAMERMRKIEALLLGAAAEMPDAAERALFLNWACRDNEILRSRVESLLDIHAGAEQFFDFEPFEATLRDETSETTTHIPDDTVEIGLRIGRYRLLSVLGEGGGGVVYLAEQETPITLWSYRRSEYPQALEWTRRALIADDLNSARIASSTIVQAMALWGLGRRSEALERVTWAAKAHAPRFFNPNCPRRPASVPGGTGQSQVFC